MRFWLVCSSALTVCASPAAAGVVYFTHRPAFASHAAMGGGVHIATETFEEAELMGGKSPFPDPLSSGVPNSTVFPEGLAAPGLTMQTNRRAGPLALRDAPSGNAQAMFAVGLGAIGTTSTKVGEDLGILFGIECSIDILFEIDGLQAVGLELSRFAAFGTAGWHIGIFDADDAFIGQYVVAGPVAAEPATNFFGVWSDTPIARINLFDLSAAPSPDAVDNIEMWVPAPGVGASLLVLGFAGFLRRRRERCEIR